MTNITNITTKNSPIELSEILVGVKRSRAELDMEEKSIKEMYDLIKHYESQRISDGDICNIIESHFRQNEFRKLLLKSGVLPKNILWAADITKELAHGRKLVMACGGDWAVEIVSHKLDGKTLLMPANSDYKGSVGANAYYDARNIAEALENIRTGNYQVEEWIRLTVERNGEMVQDATCAVFIGEKIRDDMSRQYVELKGVKEKTTSSGMLIATPAGSTGWYDSEYYFSHKCHGVIPKTEDYAKFILTSPYPPGKEYKSAEGELRKGEEMIITSLNDNQGEISIDSIEHYKFERGTVAKVRVSDVPLRIIKA